MMSAKACSKKLCLPNRSTIQVFVLSHRKKHSILYAVLISAGRQQSWDILFLWNKILSSSAMWERSEYYGCRTLPDTDWTLNTC